MAGIERMRFDHWGAEASELERPLECDRFLPDHDRRLIRAVGIDAPAAKTFRWITQLRVAPYSYDWIDNLGRTSPRELIPGLDELEPGQRFQSIFTLVAFEPGRSVTMRHSGRLFGEVVVTYLAEPVTAGCSRLFVRMLVRRARNPLGSMLSPLLPAGDLVMMRKQLLTLKRLAEGRD